MADKKEYQKQYYIAHKLEKKQYQKIRVKELTEYHKIYYLKHKEKITKQFKEYHRKYYQIHKEELNKKQKINSKNRRKIDINFKLRCNLGARIWLALKGIGKLDKTIFLIGCSLDFLKQHLESKFTEGMSWDNYGKWHIDHILPCASFDLSKPEEQLKCFNYTNLQPLWAKDNFNKSARNLVVLG